MNGSWAKTRGRLLLLAAATLFGLTAMVTRLVTQAGFSGGQAALMRFAVSIALVMTIFQLRPGTFRPSRYGFLFLRGVMGGFSVVFYFLALQRLPAGEATLLNNLYPFPAVVLSIFFLGERPTRHLAAALLVAGIGVFLVLGGGKMAFRVEAGVGVGLLSGLCGSVAVTAIRVLRSSVNAPTVFLSFALGGFLVSIPFAGGAWPHTGTAWVLAASVGVLGSLAQLCMTEAYGALSIPEAALWQMLTPLIAYLFGLFLGEAITWISAIGALLAASGIAYGSVFGYTRRRTQAPKTPSNRLRTCA